jgi:hypothetical protein
MININLLPEALRKKERMPLPQFLGVIAGVALFGLLGYMIVRYQFAIVPDLQSQRDNLARTRARLQEEAQELAVVNGEIGRLSSLVEAVKTLYRQRRVWSKVLADLKHIVNFDATMSDVNPDGRYIWLTSFSTIGSNIHLQGYATVGNNRAQAIQLPERFLEGFLTYAPVSLPEKDEEARIQEELRVATADYEVLRAEQPELPLQGPEEIRLRQRLAEIKTVKSGGIAMQPFNALLVPGSLKLNSMTWTGTPHPNTRLVPVGEDFPEMGWQFNISMELK